MLLAVCTHSRAEAERLCAQCRSADPSHGLEPVSVEPAHLPAFVRAHPGCAGAVIALGGTDGFLCTRRVRECSLDCRILVIDDTDDFALHCMRLHVTDYLVRPVAPERLARALALLLQRP